MENFRKLLRLTATWHYAVLQAIDDMMNPVENNFVQQNYEFLEFKKSFTNSSIISWCGKRGLRVDRIIVCEVLKNSKSLNQQLQVGHSFTYHPSKFNNIAYSPASFTSDYKMDVLKS